MQRGECWKRWWGTVLIVQLYSIMMDCYSELDYWRMYEVRNLRPSEIIGESKIDILLLPDISWASWASKKTNNFPLAYMCTMIIQREVQGCLDAFCNVLRDVKRYNNSPGKEMWGFVSQSIWYSSGSSNRNLYHRIGISIPHCSTMDSRWLIALKRRSYCGFQVEWLQFLVVPRVVDCIPDIPSSPPRFEVWNSFNSSLFPRGFMVVDCIPS